MSRDVRAERAGSPPARWVRIHRVELNPSERSDAIPADTAEVPFEAWVNGWLQGDAATAENVEIRTATGRVIVGELVETDPGYQHTFGSPPKPLQVAVRQAVALIGAPDQR